MLVGATFPAIVGAAPVGAAPPGVAPESVSAVLPPGGSTDAEKTITTPEQPPSLDVYFLSDTTGSMSSALADVQTNSATILSTVQGGSADVRFGAGNYREVGCDTPFDNQAPIPAADDGGAAASAAIAAWSAVGGCDVPEAALSRVAGARHRRRRVPERRDTGDRLVRRRTVARPDLPRRSPETQRM